MINASSLGMKTPHRNQCPLPSRQTSRSLSNGAVGSLAHGCLRRHDTGVDGDVDTAISAHLNQGKDRFAHHGARTQRQKGINDSMHLITSGTLKNGVKKLELAKMVAEICCSNAEFTSIVSHVLIFFVP